MIRQDAVTGALPEEKEYKMAKLDGKKLLACCANGAGSSLMMENAIKKVMKRNGIKPAELRHCPVSEGKTAARNYDVVFCARTFVKTFEGIEKNGTVLIPLKILKNNMTGDFWDKLAFNASQKLPKLNPIRLFKR